MPHNGEREIVFAFYKELGDVDVLIAEALALLASLQLCQERGVCGFVVEVDAKGLVQSVSSNSLAR